LFGALKKLKELLDFRTKMQLSSIFLLLLVKSVLDGFGLGLIAPYIAVVTDSSMIFQHKWYEKLNVYTNIQTEQELIFFMSITLIAFFLIKNVFTVFVIYAQSRFVFTKRSVQGRDLFEGYMNAPYYFHLEHNSAELDRNIRFESTNVYGFVQNFLLLCSNVFLIISISIVLLIANWQAVLSIGLLILSFSSFFLFFSGRFNKRFGSTVQDSQLYVGQAMKEGLSSIIESKLFQIESFFPSRYFKHMMTNAKANWRQATLGAAPTLFFEVLAVSSVVSVVVVLSIREFEITTLFPILGLFSFAFIRLIPSVTTIVKNIQDIRFLAPAVDVVHADFQNLGKLPKENNHKNILQIKEFKHLSLKNISFSFPSKKAVNTINEITLDVSKGEAVGITGPSGSGKTTLINLILGLLKPERGHIFVNGKDMQSILASWRSIIGFVPQSISLLDASIRENIAMGSEVGDIDTNKVWSVLNEANLEKFVKDLPHELDTIIGENGMRISGGQRQRLGLARAMYHDPEVLVFDEATSSLDMETEQRITQEIMKLSGKRTMIIIAHRTSTLKDCDVIHYIKDGELVNSGKYDELKELNKDFKNLTTKK